MTTVAINTQLRISASRKDQCEDCAGVKLHRHTSICLQYVKNPQCGVCPKCICGDELKRRHGWHGDPVFEGPVQNSSGFGAELGSEYLHFQV